LVFQEALLHTDKPLRLLLFNLMTDVDDPILGFTTHWINQLAPYCEYIHIITMNAGRLDLPDNVTVASAGYELGYGKPRRVLNFYRLLLQHLRENRYDACFAHMMPLFAGLAGPFLTLSGIPTTTWYTQPQSNWQVQLGLRMSRRVVSAVESSFPIETPKLRPLGHGIDTDFFAPDSQIEQTSPPVILHVGRLTVIKNQHTLLRASADLDVRIVLIGDVPEAYPTDYKDHLIELVAELGIADKVIFAGNQTAEQVREWYRRATIAVNLTKAGSFDKAPLESMACAVPTLVCNPAFDPLMGQYVDDLRFASTEDVAGLREKVTALLTMSDTQRKQIGEHLRQQVIEQHSFRQLIGKLVSVLRDGEFVDAQRHVHK